MNLRRFRWSLMAVIAGWATSALCAERVDFRREILPLLSDTCFACHGPDTQKVKGGLRLDVRDSAVGAAKSGKIAILPGKPTESELVRRIQTRDEDDQMPPKESHKALTTTQKELLARWIAEGAEYKGHWAYEPPVKPATPAGSRAIDHLVRARLKHIGLQPAAVADRRTLVRRLHGDLTGVRPTPSEVDAFVNDRSPDAYVELVERLLASPRFGERMAIGWLDVVRFADTIGYHSDTPRDIWPYRDYVIRSFNQNKRFDRFTREQIAGDLMPGAGLEELLGSAFNRLLLTTEEGGAQEKDYESRYLTDRVRAIGAVWLGQTIGCAQCHDHKFDPITARDFYSMGAFFADIQEPIIGARGPGALIPNRKQAPILAAHVEKVATLEKDYAGPHPEVLPAFAEWETEQRGLIAREDTWVGLMPETAKSDGEATLKIRDNRSVLVSGKKPDTDMYRLEFTETPAATVGLRLEVLPDDSLPQKGPGRAGNGNFVLTEVVARVQKDGATVRNLPFRSSRASHEQTVSAESNPYGRWSAASVIDRDEKGESAGWAVIPETGRRNQLQLELESPLTLGHGEKLVVELQQKHGKGNHTLGCFRVGAVTDPAALRSPMLKLPAEIAEGLRKPPEQRTEADIEKVFGHFKGSTPLLADLREKLAEARKARAEFEATLARCLVTVRAEKPRTVRILPRGNWLLETGDIVEPAVPAFLVKGKPDSGRRLSRLDLAEWLVSSENPLTSRVVMNRMWKHFFGAGLSRVLDDFGAQGEPPPNQPLLDWLACEFRDSGWDWKHMVRTIVLSETYRQTSSASRELLARDPENRELARQGRWRLDAEMVRDNALSIAGLLENEIGGPSVKPYQPDGYWENLNFPVRNYEASKESGLYRRGLYVWWQRSYLHPSMIAFDAPTREECAVERNRSNIPQQALVLLNDPIYVESARAFAERVVRSGESGDDARIRWAWREGLGRQPSPDEVLVLRTLLEKHRGEYRTDPEAARRFLRSGMSRKGDLSDPSELAAWMNVTRAILNLHETITRS